MPLIGNEIRSSQDELTSANATAVRALDGVASATLVNKYVIKFTIGTEFDEAKVRERVQGWIATTGVY